MKNTMARTMLNEEVLNQVTGGYVLMFAMNDENCYNGRFAAVVDKTGEYVGYGLDLFNIRRIANGNGVSGTVITPDEYEAIFGRPCPATIWDGGWTNPAGQAQ